MELVKEEKISKTLTSSFDFEFGVSGRGFYLIEINAKAKSWLQNLLKFISFFKDDDLAVKIDGVEFPKLDGRRGLFDGEAAWSGNNLCGLRKTAAFFIVLDSGIHVLSFLVDQNPYLENIKIYRLENQGKINYLPQNNPAQDGNRRHWLAIVLVRLALENLSIKASAKNYETDDDDLKLIIDGRIEKNTESKSHSNWFWCGRALKGAPKEFNRDLNLPESPLHYLELWADKSPQLQDIALKLSVKQTFTAFGRNSVMAYTHKGVSGKEDYNRFDREILDAVNFWNNFFLSQKYPPETPLDPNLVKAIIYIESRMGYYERGDDYRPSYPDVMQVGNPEDPATHSLNNDGWVSPESGKIAREYEWQDGKVAVLDYKGEANPETPAESIKWGVRWLYHKAQGTTEAGERFWRDWKEAVMNYRSIGDEGYKSRVYKIYENGTDQNGNLLWVKEKASGSMKTLVFLVLIFAAAIFVPALYSNLKALWIFNAAVDSTVFQNINDDSDLFEARVPESKLAASMNEALLESFVTIHERVPIKDSGLFVASIDNRPYSSAMGAAIVDEKNNVLEVLAPSSPPYPPWSASDYWDEQWMLGDYVAEPIAEDINADGKTEIVIQAVFTGTGLVHPFYIFQQQEDKFFKLILRLADGVSETKMVDFNNDGKKEILHSFVLDADGNAGRSLTPWREIWAWQDGNYQRANNLYPTIYNDLVFEYDNSLINVKDQAMIYYRPTINCLREKAKTNLRKIFADGRKCLLL